jgi:arylsulfatase A-like enzyme
VSPITVFGSALAWSLVAAALHTGAVLYRVHVVRGFAKTSPLFGLTAPVAYAVIFCVVAIPLAIGARLGWKMFSLRTVTAIFAGLATFSVLLLYRKIHPLAFLAVAAGFGWQIGMLFSRSPSLQHRLTRIVAPVLGLALLAVGTGPILRSRLLERTALGRDRTAPADAPNVLLLILDTVRASSLGAYGYERPTSPVIDSLARDGTLFEFAFSTASWSLPAHASLMTGFWGHETGGDYLRRTHDSLPRIGDALRERGYLTGAFMGNAGWAGHESGMAVGFDRFVSYRNDWSQLLWSTTLTQMPVAHELIGALATADPGRALRSLARFEMRASETVAPSLRKAPEIVEAFLEWHDEIADRHPWFATLNVFDAHGPYLTPHRQRFANGRTSRDRYDGAITYVDSILGQLFQELARRGELDRTLVILTSDHGEAFGEHDETGHGGGLYLPAVHIPLIVRYPPRFPAGSRRAEPVTIADVPATILDVLGMADASLPGRSLAREPLPDDSSYVLFLSQRRVNQPEADRTSLGDTHGVLTNEWHFIRYADGTEELFRWRDDPAELTNLMETPDGGLVVPRLRSLLRSPSHARH